MKKYKFLSIIFLTACLLLGCLAPGVLALAEPELAASSVLLMQAQTGQVLYEREADVRVSPASTTKILTALVALRAVEAGEVYLSDLVPFTQEMTADLIEDGSNVELKVGETLSLEELLYCALLASGNDACNAIAVHISGSVSAFVERMNQLAAELGCTGSHFSNSYGATADDHYTTARDMAVIAQAAYATPAFINISGTPVHTVPPSNMSPARNLKNSNALISTGSVYGDEYYYPYCTAGKTGHTDAAGYCLVSFASREGTDLLAVVMNSTMTGTREDPRFNQFQDSINLYEYGFNGFQYTTVLRQGESLTQVEVKMGADESVGARPREGLTLFLPVDVDLAAYERVVTLSRGANIQAPVDEGEVLGSVAVVYQGETLFESPLVAAHDVSLSHGAYLRSQILDSLKNPLVILVILALAALFAAYFVWVARYRARRRRHLESVEEARAARQAYLDSLSPEERAALEEEARRIWQSQAAAAPAEEEAAPKRRLFARRRREEAPEPETVEAASEQPIVEAEAEMETEMGPEVPSQETGDSGEEISEAPVPGETEEDGQTALLEALAAAARDVPEEETPLAEEARELSTTARE